METRTRTADWLLGESSLAEDDSAGLSNRPGERRGEAVVGGRLVLIFILPFFGSVLCS